MFFRGGVSDFILGVSSSLMMLPRNLMSVHNLYFHFVPLAHFVLSVTVIVVLVRETI
jgi:hypothetical protein